MSVNIYKKETDTLEKVAGSGKIYTWTGTRAEYEAEKDTIPDGCYVNITDDTDTYELNFPDGTGFYPDIKDGVRGYNTSESRGADTFHPFKGGGELKISKSVSGYLGNARATVEDASKLNWCAIFYLNNDSNLVFQGYDFINERFIGGNADGTIYPIDNPETRFNNAQYVISGNTITITLPSWTATHYTSRYCLYG